MIGLVIGLVVILFSVQNVRVGINVVVLMCLDMTLFCTMSFNWDLFGLNPNLHILDMHSICSFQTSLSNVGGLSSPTIDLFTFFILIHVLSVPLAMPYFFCCCSYS